MVNNLVFEELKDLSVFLGNDIDLVQGAGGNVSAKHKGVLLIKASGFWLKDASKKDIFVQLDYKRVLGSIKQGEVNFEDYIVLDKFNTKLRPSIETTMHALMPHKFVIHVHSINVISYAVLKNAKELIEDKIGDIDWLWVPYAKPGITLTREFIQLDAPRFDVIVLANHGLVVGGDTKEEVLCRLREVEENLLRPTRFFSYKVDKIRLNTIVENTDYKLPYYDICHQIAKDSLSKKVISNNSLYPDHVIFLGAGPIPVVSYDNIQSAMSKNHKVIVIKDVGLIVHYKISDNSEEMLYCLASILARLQPNDELQYLTNNDEAELLGWDAEKYRKLIQR
jgi:rhamnose utilization protein RhaD (predicted bifunctional aldolase and dehydrogenase)